MASLRPTVVAVAAAGRTLSASRLRKHRNSGHADARFPPHLAVVRRRLGAVAAAGGALSKDIIV